MDCVKVFFWHSTFLNFMRKELKKNSAYQEEWFQKYFANKLWMKQFWGHGEGHGDERDYSFSEINDIRKTILTTLNEQLNEDYSNFNDEINNYKNELKKCLEILNKIKTDGMSGNGLEDLEEYIYPDIYE